MTTTSTPLQRALQAAKRAMGPQRYGAAGRVFECSLCGHVEFFESAPQVME